MAYYSFAFTNSNQDQVFQFEDTNQDSAVTSVGPVNHDSQSPWCQCWVGSDDKGHIVLIGNRSGRLVKDVVQNEEILSY